MAQPTDRTASLPRDIDPETGDYWSPAKPEYWEVAAAAHREAFALTDEQRAANEVEAIKCLARAQQLRQSA